MKLMTLLLAIPAALALTAKESHEGLNFQCFDDIEDNCDHNKDYIIQREEYPCASVQAAKNNVEIKPWKENLYPYSFCA